MENMEKVARFEEAINREADAEINALLSKAKEKAEEAVACADNEYLEESYRLVSGETGKLKRKLDNSVSQKSFEASKVFLSHRNKRVEEFFDALQKEIVEFSRTPEYEQRLKSIIAEIDSERPITDTSVVYVKADDTEKAKKLYPNFNIRSDKNIKLGGVTVFYPESSIYIDKTIDNSFAQQKTDFVNNKIIQF